MYSRHTVLWWPRHWVREMHFDCFFLWWQCFYWSVCLLGLCNLTNLLTQNRVIIMQCDSWFIQYFAQNQPWYSLRGLHIRITWFSLYGIRIPLFSLYGIHMPLLPYMAIQPFVLGMALLWAAMDSSLWQVLLLWRHNHMTVIVSWNTRGRERDTRNALTTRMHGNHRLSIDWFFVGFNVICYTFLGNNPIHIERRICRLSTVAGFMH